MSQTYEDYMSAKPITTEWLRHELDKHSVPYESADLEGVRVTIWDARVFDRLIFVECHDNGSSCFYHKVLSPQRHLVADVI